MMLRICRPRSIRVMLATAVDIVSYKMNKYRERRGKADIKATAKLKQDRIGCAYLSVTDLEKALAVVVKSVESRCPLSTKPVEGDDH